MTPLTEEALVAKIRRRRKAAGVLTLRWKRLGSDLPMPRRVRPEEAGHDLAVIVTSEMRGENFAAPIHLTPEDAPRITVYPGALVNFATGWAVEIPPSHFGLVHLRSSIGKARWVLASSGVVDPTYRGEVKVPMLYLGAEPYTVTHGDRLAQMMIIARPNVEDVETDTLSETSRGTGGFGSTGK
jgi:dUTP pyrophosphatase